LLVHEHTLVCDLVAVKFAFLLVEARVVLFVTNSWELCSSKSLVEFDLLLVSAIHALNANGGGLDVGFACRGDDSGNYDHLANELTLELSETPGVFI
jgi:hypothetical protein